MIWAWKNGENHENIMGKSWWDADEAISPSKIRDFKHSSMLFHQRNHGDYISPFLRIQVIPRVGEFGAPTPGLVNRWLCHGWDRPIRTGSGTNSFVFCDKWGFPQTGIPEIGWFRNWKFFPPYFLMDDFLEFRATPISGNLQMENNHKQHFLWTITDWPWFMVDISIVRWGYKPTYNWGWPSYRFMGWFQTWLVYGSDILISHVNFHISESIYIKFCIVFLPYAIASLKFRFCLRIKLPTITKPILAVPLISAPRIPIEYHTGKFTILGWSKSPLNWITLWGSNHGFPVRFPPVRDPT